MAVVIGLCSHLMPAKVSALSSDEIQSQIEELEKQNEQLQSEIDELEQQKQENFSEMEEIVREIHPALSIHDFRMARGARQTKLVFDLAVPYDSQNQRKDLKRKIDQALRDQGKQYTTVIRFDAKA